MSLQDLGIILKNEPGSLALMGELLGNAGISLEGGGVFVYHGVGIAHFLLTEAQRAKHVLESNGFQVIAVNDVLIQKLRQDVPGQLGKICRIMQENGINILVQYSDHANQLVLVVDNHKKGMLISKNWSEGKYG